MKEDSFDLKSKGVTGQGLHTRTKTMHVTSEDISQLPDQVSPSSEMAARVIRTLSKRGQSLATADIARSLSVAPNPTYIPSQ